MSDCGDTSLRGGQTSKELSSTTVFHAQVEVILGLERVIKGDDEWVIAGRKNLLFGQRALDLVALDHLLFVQDFHGVQARALLFPHKVDLANISLPDELDLVKTTGADFDVSDFYTVARVRSPKGN